MTIESVVWVARQRGGLCNNLKCLLSTIRLAQRHGGAVITSCPDLCSIYDGLCFIPEGSIRPNMRTHRSWRFIVFEEDPMESGFSTRWESRGFTEADPSQRNIDFEFERVPASMRHIYLNVMNQLTVRKDVLSAINNFAEREIRPDTVAVHVRTWLTDHWDKAPNRHKRYFRRGLFEELIERCEHVFVSSDNADYLQQLIGRFGSRIAHYQSDGPFNRSQEAFINLGLLSKCTRLIGSRISTFTEMAWWLGGCRADVILAGPNRP